MTLHPNIVPPPNHGHLPVPLWNGEKSSGGARDNNDIGGWRIGATYRLYFEAYMS